jgi:hypothetical protein
MLAAYAILLRFHSPRPHGNWDAGRVALLGGVALVIVAASVWMIYTLEILKARHFRALGFKRFAEPEDAEEQEEAVERALSAGLR